MPIPKTPPRKWISEAEVSKKVDEMLTTLLVVSFNLLDLGPPGGHAD